MMRPVQKIVVLVTLQITLIITSFLVIAYLESQTNLTGNMVNVAGKNRLLASTVQIELEHILAHDMDNHKAVVESLWNLESNIYFLKEGGQMSDIEIPALPPRFDQDWRNVESEFRNYKRTIISIMEDRDHLPPASVEKSILAGSKIIALSDTLTKKLGRDVEILSSQLVFLQIVLGVVNVAIHIFMIAFIWRILRIDTERRIKTEKFTAIGELASMMAHDMKNPLGTIRNSVEIISNHNMPGPVDEELQRIRRSIKRMSHQIDDVLNYVRTVPMTTEPRPLREVFDRSLDTVTVPSDVVLTLPDWNGAGPTVQCDAEKLELVFTNLLLNAVQAASGSGRQGHIAVRLVDDGGQQAGDDGMVSLEFENSGCRIPRNDVHRVFEPLFTTKMEGIGLGLTSCRNIVELHGGTISARRDDEEDGGIITFTIHLPRVQAR